MPAPTPAATPTAPSTSAHIFPELMDSAVSAGPFDIDAIRSDAVVPAMVVSSNPGKYAVVEAHPDVPTATAAVLHPWVLLKDRDMDVSKPTACSRFCLPNTAMLPLMATAFPQASQQRLMLRPTPWPSFWMLLAHENEVRPMPWPSFSCSHEGMTLNQEGVLPQVTCVMKNLLDRGCIDFTLGKAALPRFHIGNSAYSSKQISDLLVGRLHVMVKHSGSLQPLSSSAEVPYWFDYFISRSPEIPHSMYCQFELELKPSWLQKYLSGRLNSLTAFSRYLPSGQQVKPCIFLKVVRRIPMVPLDILIPSQPILHSMNDLNLGASRWQSVISSVQPSYEFRPQVNHITSLMVVYVCELIPMEEHFSCLQNAQLQSWRPPDGRTYADKLLNQEGCSWTVTQETSCARTVHTHASYLTYIDFINMALIGSEAMHGEHVNYKNVQSYTCCVVQPLKGVEYFVLWVASYEFYLEKFALVRNLEKKGSDNSVLCVVAPVVHSSNTGSFLNVLLLSCLSSVTSSKSCECFHGDKYMEVVQLLAHSVGQLLIGRIHKWGMQSNVLTDSFSLWLDCLEVCSVPAYLILDAHWYVGTGIEPSTLDAYRAGHQPYELISPYHQLDISKLQLRDCNSWWIFLQLHPDYMLLYAMDLLGSDLGIYQQGMSWDPGGLALLLILELTRRAALQGGSGHACLLTMPPSNQRPSKIIMERVICKGAWTMGGMTSSTFFDQEQLQGGRGITIVAAVVVQGSVDHTYYLNFDQDYADNDHFLGASLDGVTIGHGCYNHVVQVNLDFVYHHDFELVKDHRVQWDPGGSQWRRLGVKPNFKEGGMLGALLTWTCTGARPLGQPMDLARL